MGMSNHNPIMAMVVRAWLCHFVMTRSWSLPSQYPKIASLVSMPPICGTIWATSVEESASFCRALTLKRTRMHLPGISAPHITELVLQGHGKALGGETLAWLMRLARIEKLDLRDWKASAEMAGLGQLPIEEFVTNQGACCLSA